VILFINILSSLFGLLGASYIFIITICAAVFYILSLKEGKRERRAYKKYATVSVPKEESTFGEADLELKLIRVVNQENSAKLFFKNLGKECHNLEIESEELEIDIVPKFKLPPNDGGYISIKLTRIILKNPIMFKIKYINSHKMHTTNEYTFHPENNLLELTNHFSY